MRTSYHFTRTSLHESSEHFIIWLYSWTFRTFHYTKIFYLSKSQLPTSLKRLWHRCFMVNFTKFLRHKKIPPKNNFETVTAAVCKFGKILAYCKIKINMLSNLWWHHHCSDHCSDSDIVKIFCHTKRWKAVLIKAHHNSLVTNFILDPKQRYLYNECLSQIWNDSCLL